MALSDQFAVDGASIIAFLIGLVIVFDPARNVAQFFTQLQSSLIILDSICSIFEVETEDLTSGKNYVNDTKHIAIKFKNVSFGYNPNSITLKNISLEFKSGTKCDCWHYRFRKNAIFKHPGDSTVTRSITMVNIII